MSLDNFKSLKMDLWWFPSWNLYVSSSSSSSTKSLCWHEMCLQTSSRLDSDIMFACKNLLRRRCILWESLKVIEKSCWQAIPALEKYALFSYPVISSEFIISGTYRPAQIIETFNAARFWCFHKKECKIGTIKDEYTHQYAKVSFESIEVFSPESTSGQEEGNVYHRGNCHVISKEWEDFRQLQPKSFGWPNHDPYVTSLSNVVLLIDHCLTHRPWILCRAAIVYWVPDIVTDFGQRSQPNCSSGEAWAGLRYRSIEPYGASTRRSPGCMKARHLFPLKIPIEIFANVISLISKCVPII